MGVFEKGLLNYTSNWTKYFSSFGYTVAFFRLPSLLILSVYTGNLSIRERLTFICRSSPDSRDECLVKYDEQYNSPFPLYGFVLLCFLSPLAVCITYSWCFVKSRVDEIAIALKRYPESPRLRVRLRTRRVFYSYFLHLLVRLVLGILFAVLQNFVFYPDGFPTEFACVFPTVKPTVLLNSTDFNVTKDDGLAIDCYNFKGSDNATCAMVIWAVNILFASLVCGELCYLSVRALQSEEFTFDCKFCQNYLFNHGGTAATRHETILRMKRQVRGKRLSDDIFVDLVMCRDRVRREFADFTRRHEIFGISLRNMSYRLIVELEELLQDSCTILVIGHPGIGKSYLCKKLMHDWSCGELLRYYEKSFEYLFLVKFRWFNTEKTEKISLRQLLSWLYSEGSINNEVFEDIVTNPEKVLLIFDGLDEFKHYEECFTERASRQYGNSPTEEMPFSALYVKLVDGTQLPGATILTTCRPNELQSLVELPFDKVVEIIGFTPEKVEEYVHKFCADDIDTMNRIWGLVSSSSELLSMCYIPFNIFNVCSFLKRLIKRQDQDSGISLPTTSTEIYNEMLRRLIFNFNPEFEGAQLTEDYLEGKVCPPDSIEAMFEAVLSQVGPLAKTGIEEGRVFFSSSEVQGMENCGLLHRLPDRQISAFVTEGNFCFLHLSWQEFLAARELAKKEPSELSAFILLKASDLKWHLVIQFVAGLLHGKKNEVVDTFISLLCECLTTMPPVESETKLKALLMMKCLYEYKDETTLQKAADELKNSEFKNKVDLANCQMTAADYIAVMYFLRHLHEIVELNICGNNIADQGILLMSDALKDVNCKLTKLDLSYNNMTDQGVVQLCVALKHVDCELAELDLSSNNITDQGVKHLSDALKDVNCELAKLDLSDNSITDQGVLRLCEVLKDVNCKLTVLNLSSTKITDQGVLHLHDALTDGKGKLTELDLSDTYITNQGMSHLCDALKDIKIC